MKNKYSNNIHLSLKLVQQHALKYLEKFNTSENHLKSFLFQKFTYKYKINQKDVLNNYINETIIWLKNLGYLNDNTFCENKIKSLLNSGNSILQIEQKLIQKGISKNQIKETFIKIVNDENIEILEKYAALKFALKKNLLLWQKEDNIENNLKNLQKFIRAGFNVYLAKELFLEFNSNEECEEFLYNISKKYNL